MNKSQTRKYFQNIRKYMSSESKILFSNIITEKIKIHIINLILQSKINKSLHICLFSATKNEPNLLHLLTIFQKEIVEEKIFFYFPKCENFKNPENIMNFYEVKRISDLRLYTYEDSKDFTILEPNIEICNKLDILKHTNNIDLFVIPAVSVDNNNNRIGMGAGFYDKYFEKYFLLHNKKNSTIICTIFSEQISNTLFTEFTEKFDIPADTVVTEK